MADDDSHESNFFSEDEIEKIPLLGNEGINSTDHHDEEKLHQRPSRSWRKRSSVFFRIPETLQTEQFTISYKDFWGLYCFLCIFFLLPRKSLPGKIFFGIFQLLIWLSAIFENAVSIWFLDTDPFSRATEVGHFIRLTATYIWLIYYFRHSHLLSLLQFSFLEDAKQTHFIVNRSLLAGILLIILQTISYIPVLLTLSYTIPEYTDILSALSTIGKFILCSIWGFSLITFWISTNLIINRWLSLLSKLKKGLFSNISEAISEYAKLGAIQSKMNHLNQGYLFFAVTICVASILGCISASLTSGKIIIWGIAFLFEVIFLFSICLPGAYVTTLIRRVLKRANRMRVLTDGTDQQSIQEVDSFLLYLYTSGASFKASGVTIDLGFITKLIVSTFTICAFIIQRELS